jgi:hypothetical protein
MVRPYPAAGWEEGAGLDPAFSFWSAAHSSSSARADISLVLENFPTAKNPWFSCARNFLRACGLLVTNLSLIINNLFNSLDVYTRTKFRLLRVAIWQQ